MKLKVLIVAVLVVSLCTIAQVIDRQVTQYIEADSTFDSEDNSVTLVGTPENVRFDFKSTSSATEAYMTFTRGDTETEPINPTGTPTGTQVRGVRLKRGTVENMPINPESGQKILIVSDSGTADIIVTSFY